MNRREKVTRPAKAPPAWVQQESTDDRAGRALATIVHLPRICRFRKCRRSQLCVGQPARCLDDHAGLGKARWQNVLEREALARRAAASGQLRGGCGALDRATHRQNRPRASLRPPDGPHYGGLMEPALQRTPDVEPLI
jgi:hypothetical protein